MSGKQLLDMRRLRAAEAQLESLCEMLDSKCPDLQKAHAETIAETIDTCIDEVQDEIHALLEGHTGGNVASNMLMTYIDAEGEVQLPRPKRLRLHAAASEAAHVRRVEDQRSRPPQADGDEER